MNISIPVELLEQLITVCSWYETQCNLSRLGETYELCGDQSAFDYLQGEAAAIKLQAEQYIPEPVTS